MASKYINMDNIRLNIKSFIKDKNLQITDVSKRMGISRQTFYDVMSSKQRMTLEFYIKFCEVVNKEPERFFSDSYNMSDKSLLEEKSNHELSEKFLKDQIIQKDEHIKFLQNLINERLK